MAYPGYGGAFGNFSGQIPGMQMQMGQPVPGAGPNVFSGGYPGYLAYSDSYSPADDSMWTYFTAVAGQMGFNEFKELWAALSAWKQNFMTIDQDQSGYRLSPQTLAAIVRRYSKNGRIFFDDYVACCVKLRALTGHYDNLIA
ncbi:Grancalcin [Apodemus speciosus]|uniref:Grancalcin n=1 Tax=Apodemus speciosus TaxID=105296 RepID=A0ABQ0EHB0_APOSI